MAKNKDQRKCAQNIGNDSIKLSVSKMNKDFIQIPRFIMLQLQFISFQL